MTGQQPELPWDPGYVAACDAVYAAKHDVDAAVAVWEAAVRRRNRYLTADGVLPRDQP